MSDTFFCPMCETDRAFRRERQTEEYQVRGEPVLLEVPRLTCLTCGESVVDSAFGDVTVKLYAEYRRRHGLLTPEQIRDIRDKYDLSQVSFAALLGASPATLARYETGSIQDKAYDHLLRECDDPAFMSKLMAREGHKLSPAQHAAALAALKLLEVQVPRPRYSSRSHWETAA